MSLQMDEMLPKHIGEILKETVMCDCIRVVADNSMYLSKFAVVSMKSVRPE
jgi:hypothetical protein